MTDNTDYKPILCLDFDGVIHSYTSPWTEADEIHDGPVPGALEFIERALLYFEVHIFSSRSNQEGGIRAMRNYLEREFGKRYGVDPTLPIVTNRDHCVWSVMRNIRWPTEKPPAFIGIDDRVLTFNGTWPTMEELKAFKPWNKGGAAAIDKDKIIKALLYHFVTNEGTDYLGTIGPIDAAYRYDLSELSDAEFEHLSKIRETFTAKL